MNTALVILEGIEKEVAQLRKIIEDLGGTPSREPKEVERPKSSKVSAAASARLREAHAKAKLIDKMNLDVDKVMGPIATDISPHRAFLQQVWRKASLYDSLQQAGFKIKDPERKQA